MVVDKKQKCDIYGHKNCLVAPYGACGAEGQQPWRQAVGGDVSTTLLWLGFCSTNWSLRKKERKKKKAVNESLAITCIDG